MPTTRSGCASGAAISVTDSAEVFVASTVSAATDRSTAPNSSCLTSRLSNTASITRSQPASASTSEAGSSSAERPRRALRRERALVDRAPELALDGGAPRSASSGSPRRRRSGSPACTQSCAIPAPIVPSPTTPAFLTGRAVSGSPLASTWGKIYQPFGENPSRRRAATASARHVVTRPGPAGVRTSASRARSPTPRAERRTSRPSSRRHGPPRRSPASGSRPRRRPRASARRASTRRGPSRGGP